MCKILTPIRTGDSFIIVFTVLDRIHHFLLGDKDHEVLVKEAYRRVDVALQEIVWKADHSPEGILVVDGAKLVSSSPSIMDIAPTILSLQKQTAVEAIDGNTLSLSK